MDVDFIKYYLSEGLGVSLYIVYCNLDKMDFNLILRICQEFYDENPMMITSLVIFFLVYVYYRVRVVQLPVIHCRDNSKLYR